MVEFENLKSDWDEKTENFRIDKRDTLCHKLSHLSCHKTIYISKFTYLNMTKNSSVNEKKMDWNKQRWIILDGLHKMDYAVISIMVIPSEKIIIKITIVEHFFL